MNPKFFRSPASFRAWLSKHHAATQELLVGFHKKGSRKSSTIRFTPRRPRSIWSAVNIARARALNALGLMQPSGLAAFAAREENRSGIYAYEQRSDTLPDPYAGILKRNNAASAFFRAQPPSYRKTIAWWVLSAKQEATRLKRLNQLIEASAHGTRL